MASISEVRKRPRSQVLLDVAHGSIFPFIVLKFVKSSTKQTFVQEIELHPRFYDHLVRRYGIDEVLTYCDMASARIEAWTPSMILSINLMNQMGLMSSPKEWVVRARRYISNLLSDKPEPLREEVERKEERIKIATKILQEADLLDQIKGKKDLERIAKDVARTGLKDSDSAIYRLAMMLYHSKRLTEEPEIPELEEAATIYLKLSQSKEIAKDFPYILKKFEEVSPPARAECMKTFMSFIIASYICFKSMVELEES